MGQSGGLGSDSLKDIVDKAVHDGHGLARCRWHSFPFFFFLLALLVAGANGLLGTFGTDLRMHGYYAAASLREDVGTMKNGDLTKLRV